MINLIGATYETRNYSFDDVHATWPAHLAALAKESPLLERCALSWARGARAGARGECALAARVLGSRSGKRYACCVTRRACSTPNTHQPTHTPTHPPHPSFVHVSDLGASADHPSARMRSKAKGDAAVMDALPGLATVLRPAPVVGDEDDFLNNLLMQARGGRGAGGQRAAGVVPCWAAAGRGLLPRALMAASLRGRPARCALRAACCVLAFKAAQAAASA